MEPLARLDSKSILSEEIFLEIFDQEDEITKARMILSLTDRAGELGVKKKFEELLKAYKRVDKEAKQRERKKPITMLDKWTNFEGPYNNMFCGACFRMAVLIGRKLCSKKPNIRDSLMNMRRFLGK